MGRELVIAINVQFWWDLNSFAFFFKQWMRGSNTDTTSSIHLHVERTSHCYKCTVLMRSELICIFFFKSEWGVLTQTPQAPFICMSLMSLYQNDFLDTNRHSSCLLAVIVHCLLIMLFGPVWFCRCQYTQLLHRTSLLSDCPLANLDVS